MYIRSIGIAGLLIGILFKVLHWPGANVLLLISGVLVIVTMTILLVKKPGPWSIQIRRPGMLVAAVAAVLAGVVFKMMYWPGANIFLLLGMTGCAVWLLMGPAKRASA